MQFHSLATPDPNANAVGPLELRCTAHELIVYHHSVRRRVSGAPLGPVVSGTQTRIPWAEVKARRAGQEGLYLDLGPHRTTLNRFYLTRFSKIDQQGAPAQRPRKSLFLLSTTCLLILAAILATGYFMPTASDHLATLVATGTAAASALLLLLVGRAAGHRWTLKPNSSRRVLAELIEQLNERIPNAVDGSADIATSRAQQATPSPLSPPLSKWGARPGAGWAIGVAVAATAITAWFTLGNSQPTMTLEVAASIADEDALSRTQLSVQPAPTKSPTTPATVRSMGPMVHSAPGAVQSATPQWEEACDCKRPDSLLWPSAIERLSALVLTSTKTHLKGVQKTQVQIGIVNNGNRDLREIALSVEFPTEPSEQSRTVAPSTIRPLFYAGPLRPGRAVKWTVEGPGSQFKLVAPDFGTLLTDGSDAATGDDFYRLTNAHSRPVRMHAARLLTYVGDRRAAKSVELLLAAKRPEEVNYLHQVKNAAEGIQVCGTQVQRLSPSSSSVKACFENQSTQSPVSLKLQLRAWAGPVNVNEPTAPFPTLLATSHYNIGGALAASTGKTLSLVHAPNTQPAGNLNATALSYFDWVVTTNQSAP